MKKIERTVEQIRRRLFSREILRLDAEEKDTGWRTIKKTGQKIHLNEKGEIDKGNPHVVAAMEEKGAKVSSGMRGSVDSVRVKEAEVIQKAADKFADEDIAKIPEKKQFVRDNMGTDVRPFKREATNLKKIEEEGGCTPEEAKRAAKLAEGIVDRAEKSEPKITSDIVGVVKDAGGTMYGLDFRLKQSSSMGRKIASDAKEEGWTFEEAAGKVKDAIRYTAMFDEDNYTDGYNSVKKALEAKGYKEQRCRNYFKKYADDPDYPQKAVQSVFVSPDGDVFEFQFHTVNSAGTKEVSHPMYEEARNKSTSKRKARILNRRMRRIYETVPDPKGVLSIKSHG